MTAAVTVNSFSPNLHQPHASKALHISAMYVYVPHPPNSFNPPHNTFRFHVPSDGDDDSVSKKKEKNRERGTTGIF
ncbi:hypothetical protein Hdeb2414_s0023g00627621 [Helianthus debilis subsp. tardiflorus]